MGLTYLDDRVTFSAAGGLDVARLSGLAGFALVLVVFALTLTDSSDLLVVPRSPWMYLLLSTLVAQLIAVGAAVHVFTAVRRANRDLES